MPDEEYAQEITGADPAADPEADTTDTGHAQEVLGADPPKDTEAVPATLAAGAEGDDVEKLKGLLRLVGYDVARNNVLGPDCMAIVTRAKQDLDVVERELFPADIPGKVLGELVGPETWQALYDQARKVLARA